MFVVLLLGNAYFLYTWCRYVLPLVVEKVRKLILRLVKPSVNPELSSIESPRPPSSSRRILPADESSDSSHLSPPCNSSVAPGCEQVTFQVAQ